MNQRGAPHEDPLAIPGIFAHTFASAVNLSNSDGRENVRA